MAWNFYGLEAGTLFRGADSGLYVKLANGTAVSVSTWETIPFGDGAIVFPVGRLRKHSRKPKLKLIPYRQVMLGR